MSIEVNVPEARQRPGHEAAFLVDVREPYEYAAAHVPHARLVPLGALPEREAELPGDRHMLFIWGAPARKAPSKKIHAE